MLKGGEWNAERGGWWVKNRRWSAKGGEWRVDGRG